MSAASREPQHSPAIAPAARRRGLLTRLFLMVLAAAAVLPALAVLQGSPAAQAAELSATATATARIQALLANPVNGVVNLPAGTFTIAPVLRLSQGETIIGHHTTLRVAAGAGNYPAMLAGASPATDLSGLTIEGITFDQNTTGNPIRRVASLYSGSPRFVILVSRGTGIRIIGNMFAATNNVNTIATGSATRNVTISGNQFQAFNTPRHDHSSIYTSGVGTTISNNRFTGNTIYSAAIEVHGDQVTITGNQIRGYFRGANIASSDTTFRGNTVTGAGCPVDLWSTVAPGLHNVVVSGNVLNRNLPAWARVLRGLALPMPAARYTQPVSKDAASKYPFTAIVTAKNKG